MVALTTCPTPRRRVRGLHDAGGQAEPHALREEPQLSYKRCVIARLCLGEDLYELFGRYGAIRQIRIGNTPQTRGTAYVVFEEIGDAKSALTNLNGFHLQERYIIGTFLC